MKRGKRRWKGRPNEKNVAVKAVKAVKDWRIILIHDGPSRTRAARECNRAMAKLEKARAELRRFEQEDRPLFGRWMAATFGALLTELRDNARLVDEQEGLIEEVELEMMWSNHRNPRRAYAAVMKHRESAGEDDDFDGADARREEGRRSQNGPERGCGDAGDARGDDGKDDFDPFDGMGAGIPEEDRRVLFDDFLKSVLGIHPKQMGKAEYEKMFAEFEAEMFGKGPGAGPFQVHDEGKRPAGRDDARIKEIYRILVRRLHPDVRADGDATVSAIWHEVQAAYEGRNLDRLETLLALTEMENGTNGGGASLSQMKGALAELNRAFRAIQRSLGKAKGDPAWGFSREAYHGPMEKRVRRELEESLSQQRWVLAELKRTLDDWSRPWRQPVKKPRKQSRAMEEGKGKRPENEADVPRAVQTEFFAF